MRTQQIRNGSAAVWDDMYHIQNKILSSVTKSINESSSLPSSVDYSFGGESVSFVLAHDFYGDAERGDEIETRNSVRNPLFCGRDLELLSD